MSWVVCSCPGSSCKSVLLDDAEVSVLETYKSFTSSVVVAGGEVLSVCVCTASSACLIVMAMYGFCEGSVAVCVCWLEDLISKRY